MLNKCWDCGGKVSTAAVTCPHCGRTGIGGPVVSDLQNELIASERVRRRVLNVVGVLAVIFLLVAVVLDGGETPTALIKSFVG